MKIPTRCDHCQNIAYMVRFPFAWGTFCNWCHFGEVKYDNISLSHEEKN